MTRRTHTFHSEETEDGFRVTEPGNDVVGYGATIFDAFRNYVDKAEAESRRKEIAPDGGDK